MYININFDGNISYFARVYEISRITASKWVNQGYIWVEGEGVQEGVYSLRMEKKND
jgi:hypothetical protein